MPPEVAVVEVTRTRTVVVEVPGPSYSDARVLAYLRTVLNTNGDLLTVAAGTLARVGLGSSGQVLTVSGGAPVWAAPPGFANPMTAPGDLIIGGASGSPTRLPRGTDGQILSVSGSTLAWIDPVTQYTDADAISAIAGEATDHQLIQRVNANDVQGISLSTIYDGTIDAIEALGNGVLVTAGGVLDNVVGTEGQVLTWTGGTAVFAAAAGGSYTDPLTTNGDMVVRAGGVTTRLPVGSDGQVLRVSLGAPTWGADVGFANPMTTLSDLIVGGVSGAPGRLGIGSNGQQLTVASGAPAYRWAPAAFAFPQGWGLNRVAAAAALNAVTPAQSASRSGTTFAAGTQNAWGMTQTATTTTATTIAGAQAAVFDDGQKIGPHRFVASGTFSGVIGVSGGRFFAGVAQASGLGSPGGETFTLDAPTTPAVGFFVRGASDTTFQILVASTTATQIVNTGVTATEGNQYGWVYTFRDLDGTRTVEWWIYSVTFGATVTLLGTGTVTCTADPTETLVTVPGCIQVGARVDSSATYSCSFGDALIFNWGA